MSEDLASVEEKIRMLRGLRERIDEDLRDLEDTVTRLEDREERTDGLEMVNSPRGLILGEKFEVRIRHSGSSLLITIPVRVVRELGLEPGERAIFQIRRKGDLHAKS